MKTGWTLLAVLAALNVDGAPIPETEMPEVVVTATGHESPVSALAHSITVISRTEIERNGWRSLPEALRQVPGLYINQSGGPGSPVSTFIRGTRSQHVLVMLNGVRLNDPSDATRSADLAAISVDDIERIEVVRGPQSGLYGADAVSGVINIITRRGAQRPEISIEAGSYETYKVAGSLGGQTGVVDYAAAASYLDSQGFSSASDRYEGNSERDAFSALNVSARLGLKPTKALAIDLSARYVNAENEFDEGGGPFSDSEDNVSRTESFSAHGAVSFGSPDSVWSQTLLADYAVFDREFESSWGTSTFDGDNWEAEWRHDVVILDSHTLSLGIVYNDESAESDTFSQVSADTASAYLQDEFAYGPLNAVASVRYDDHDQFGDETTYRVAPSIRVARTHSRLKGSIGTAFKAPSLYQLYAPAGPWGPVGNANLNPEQMFAWDLGVEQTIVPDRATLEVVWFQNDIDDLIEYGNGYENVAEARSRGIEVSANITPLEKVIIHAGYTYTDSKDKTTGAKLIRIPEHRGTLNIAYAVTERLALNLTITHVGQRDDLYFDQAMFVSRDVKTDAYTTADVSASYDLTANVTLFGRVENLTDEDYEEVYGYGTPGISGYGGARMRF